MLKELTLVVTIHCNLGSSTVTSAHAFSSSKLHQSSLQQIGSFHAVVTHSYEVDHLVTQINRKLWISERNGW